MDKFKRLHLPDDHPLKKYEALVVGKASKYFDGAYFLCDADDLVQNAWLGVLTAIKLFDKKQTILKDGNMDSFVILMVHRFVLKAFYRGAGNKKKRDEKFFLDALENPLIADRTMARRIKSPLENMIEKDRQNYRQEFINKIKNTLKYSNQALFKNNNRMNSKIYSYYYFQKRQLEQGIKLRILAKKYKMTVGAISHRVNDMTDYFRALYKQELNY